ncbi:MULTISPECIES: M48 family metalloprotease [Streptosporangium]|uniref:Zn-dependent protease with chaperone function n=1 Tax=Streptosporangium brasiliense TaxID=47480 RepID=A0ABT9RN06_9ACTN|nr:M48 family metalloprotease [Streptosporangium brasiliense]MDP9870473.1 Zn-dependent protease with chaperone function [Streptosporangium brasiliense]
MAPRTAPFAPAAVRVPDASTAAGPAQEATLPGLAELTSALACAVHAPAVLVTVDPTLEDGALAYGTGCDSVPRVVLGAELLADEMRLRGVLAHEIAHHALAHGRGAIHRWQIASHVAGGAALAAVIIGLPVWMVLACAAAAIGAHLAAARVQRREEYDADTYSVQLLEAAGLDGRAIVATTLAAVPQETRWYRLAGWIGGSHPTPDARRRNIAHSRRALVLSIRS